MTVCPYLTHSLQSRRSGVCVSPSRRTGGLFFYAKGVVHIDLPNILVPYRPSSAWNDGGTGASHRSEQGQRFQVVNMVASAGENIPDSIGSHWLLFRA